MVTVPATTDIGQGVAGTISGTSVSEAFNTPSEIFTVTLTDATGQLSATGSRVNSSGTNRVTITGGLSAVNAALATLTDIEPTSGIDTIGLSASDSYGGVAMPGNVEVTINGRPTLTVPGSAQIVMGQTGTIVGVSLAESGDTSNETFSVTLSSVAGL